MTMTMDRKRDKGLPDGNVSTIRRFLRKSGFHAVYVIGPADGTVGKIGIASDPIDRAVQIQIGNWVKLKIWHYRWMGGRLLTARVEARVKSTLKEHNLSGEWFNLHPDAMIVEADKAIKEFGIPILRDEDLRRVGYDAYLNPDFDWRYDLNVFR